ncbi:Gfo/Idh/MocA family protein [Parapedobacter sp. GCM10030251]|uniref:Gfo/Idh/MocA family protein n=1 Tax=Parapedobacter sp. GCM10030251 TaxID=3273419 RepID=UPI0036197CFA
MERREFIRKGMIGATGAALTTSGMSAKSYASILGSNERVNVAVIGIRGMGQNHIEGYSKLKNARVTALCDIDRNFFEPRIKKHFVDKGLEKPKTYTDLRVLYENKDVDAVSIVTPNHWHALAAIWAIQAGKHVSVEKPCCHNIYEGRKLVEAAEKYPVIVQDGAEQRSNPCAESMADFLHAGKLGEVYMAKGICYKRRHTIGRTPDEPIPPGVDYDLWLGPAPERPFSKNRFHYNWHWNWEYGNGDIGNQGVHEMDIARWGLNVALPTRISSIGGHFMFDDDQQTPNTQLTVFEFPNPQGGGDAKKLLQFEVRHWLSNSEGIGGENPNDNTYMVSSDNEVGNLFFGSKGYMTKNLNRWQTFMGDKKEPGENGKGFGNHYANFIDAIRYNDQKLAKGDIREGFYSCALIHLGNIAYRVGRTLNFDPVAMKFINDPEADALLTREYRSPFIVPDVV